MGYATVSDIEAMNAGRAAFGTSTKPTASQVVTYIENVSAQLELHLRVRGYQVPVPTSASITRLLLRDATMKGAHALVETASPNDARAKAAEQMWKDAVAMLDTDELDAPLDPSASSGVQASTQTPILSIASLVKQVPYWATGDL